jgi:hypothetical protein
MPVMMHPNNPSCWLSRSYHSLVKDWRQVSRDNVTGCSVARNGRKEQSIVEDKGNASTLDLLESGLV